MPTRSYHRFEPGIKQDDYLTGGANFIEGNNVTGLNTGYGATLGPKVNKQLLTNTAPRAIFGLESLGVDLEGIAAGCDNGEIYSLGIAVDNTPDYTLTNNWDIVNGVYFNNYMYFISKDPTSTAAKMAQVEILRVVDGTFTGINESFLDFFNEHTPPILLSSGNMFIGGSGQVIRYSPVLAKSTFSIFNGRVVGITVHGTQYMVYTDKGVVSYWDGVTNAVTANIDLGFVPERVTQNSGFDEIITTDGDYYMGSGYSFQLITKKKQSNRLEDNTQYIKKFDFTPTNIIGQPIVVARGGTFLLSSDTKPGIYRKEELIQGLPESYHKSITKDNTNTDFDELFTMTYLGVGQSKLFFGYQSGTTTFGVDYIDLNSKETAKDGYLISDVFSGGTAFNKKIDVIRFAKSYCSGDDYLKLYKRINNGAWIEIVLTQPVDDIITRENLTAGQNERNIDIQFKIEFHNEAQDENSPMLGELSMDYTITET